MRAVRSASHRLRVGTGLLAFLCAVSAARAAGEPLEEIQDPHYGEVLFQFYQQKYFSAATHLLAAEQSGRIPHYATEAELLRGGLYLSYGLHDEATRIFERLIAEGAPPEARDRAWFYLGKIRHQRGYAEAAEEALARIEGRLPVELEDERLTLSALLVMNRGDYAKAAEQLEHVRSPEWSAYARYNLGVALIKAGKTEDGIRLLDKLGRASAASAEMAALRDRANLALGFHYLHAGLPADSRAYLDRVRLQGLLSNKALLGLGWANLQIGLPKEALIPWLELNRRPPFDPAVQEVLLAVPYAYGQLGAYQQSLRYYRQAIDAYEREAERIDDSIRAIRTGRLSERILRGDPLEELGWFWRLNELPDAPEARYLLHLLASHSFHEAFKNYRDLRFLLANLEQNAASLAVYQDMLANRRQGYAERLPRVVKDQGAYDMRRHREQRELLASELARVEYSEDALALANEAERARLARLARVAERLKRLPANEDTRAAQEKYARLRGLMLWDLTQEYKARLYEAKQSLRGLDEALAEATQRREHILTAQLNAPETFAGFERRIDDAGGRIERLRAQLSMVAAEQERQLEALAVEELERQRSRLQVYLTQARFAVAQMYDRASGKAENP